MIDTKADWNIYMYMYIGDYVLLILITIYMYTCDSFYKSRLQLTNVHDIYVGKFTKNKFQNMYM